MDGVTKTEGELHFFHRIGNLGLQGSERCEMFELKGFFALLRSQPSCFNHYRMAINCTHTRMYERQKGLKIQVILSYQTIYIANNIKQGHFEPTE